MLCKCFSTCWDNDNFFLDLFSFRIMDKFNRQFFFFLGEGGPSVLEHTVNAQTLHQQIVNDFEHCLNTVFLERWQPRKIYRCPRSLDKRVHDFEGLHRVCLQKLLILKTVSVRSLHKGSWFFWRQPADTISKNINILSPKRRKPLNNLKPLKTHKTRNSSTPLEPTPLTTTENPSRNPGTRRQSESPKRPWTHLNKFEQPKIDETPEATAKHPKQPETTWNHPKPEPTTNTPKQLRTSYNLNQLGAN